MIEINVKIQRDVENVIQMNSNVLTRAVSHTNGSKYECHLITIENNTFVHLDVTTSKTVPRVKMKKIVNSVNTTNSVVCPMINAFRINGDVINTMIVRTAVMNSIVSVTKIPKIIQSILEVLMVEHIHTFKSRPTMFKIGKSTNTPKSSLLISH